MSLECPSHHIHERPLSVFPVTPHIDPAMARAKKLIIPIRQSLGVAVAYFSFMGEVVESFSALRQARVPTTAAGR